MNDIAKKNTTTNTTLVFDPTAKRPWVGLYEHKYPRQKHVPSKKRKRIEKNSGRFLWKTSVTGIRPGHVNFWGALTSKGRSLPANRILVVTGPGSFTGTRAAVNIANGLGYSWDVPVISTQKKTSREFLELLNASSQNLDGFRLKTRALPFYALPPNIG